MATSSCLSFLNKSDVNGVEGVQFWRFNIVYRLILYFILPQADGLSWPENIEFQKILLTKR